MTKMPPIYHTLWISQVCEYAKDKSQTVPLAATALLERQSVSLVWLLLTMSDVLRQMLNKKKTTASVSKWAVIDIRRIL